MIERTGRKRFGLKGLAIFAAAALFLAAGAEALADKGWVNRPVRIKVRKGASLNHKWWGVIESGHPVEILERGEKWTKIRTNIDGFERDGWIQVGYLRPEPPPTIRLERAETRVVMLEEELSELKGESTKLRDNNEILSTQDSDQQAKIKELTMDNMELRAGARYPEWITGASIFAAGMVAGAMVHRRSARRQPSRIRL